jgi:hypothetical protein
MKDMVYLGHLMQTFFSFFSNQTKEVTLITHNVLTPLEKLELISQDLQLQSMSIASLLAKFHFSPSLNLLIPNS